MLARAVAATAGALVLTGAALAQTTEPAAPLAQPVAKTAAAEPKAAQPAPAVPDPLTPPEVEGPPPAAPGAPPATAVAPAPASVDPFVLSVRQRLASTRAREAAAEAADRAGLTAYYADDAARPVWTTAGGFNARARSAMEEIRKADDWGLKASAFDLPADLPADATTEARADAEIRLGMATLRYARHARGGRVDPQSVSKLLDRKPKLYDPRTLIQALAASEAADVYLRDLHPKHAQFRNLQKALVAARSAKSLPAEAALQQEPDAAPQAAAKGKGKTKRPAATPARDTPDQAIQRLVVNMERWRWMPDDLGAFHVWNNVPEQMTVVFKHGKEIFSERIVVGKPDTATPNFTANMQFVIFQPEWGVPPGIKNNEIAPLLRRASSESGGFFGDSSRTPASVLARHGLRVSAGGKVLDPNTINWSSVDVNRFNFIQPSGPTNVLGVVKFRFPNKHDVYMHDTPQKHLFSASTRAFSHGCMRVQNPVRFAEVLLEHDKGWASDRVRGMVPRGGTVTLSTEVPVHSVYFTAIADADGKVRTLGDLYGQDSRLASALEGRAIAVASRGEPVAGGPASNRVKGERQARPKREQGTATASNQAFNPFAGLFGN